MVALYLQREGHEVVTADDGVRALEAVREHEPHLVVLDLMLPRMDGLAVCRALRDAVPRPGIIMVTARTTEDDKLLGLDLGADDYVTKPFSPRELLARVRAVLRRVGENQEKGPAAARFGELAIDFVSHSVRLHGAPIRLTPKEFKLLEILVREPGRAFSRLELLEQVFGYDYEGLERTVDVHVMNLRKKIERDPALPVYILTVY